MFSISILKVKKSRLGKLSPTTDVLGPKPKDEEEEKPKDDCPEKGKENK